MALCTPFPSVINISVPFGPQSEALIQLLKQSGRTLHLSVAFISEHIYTLLLVLSHFFPSLPHSLAFSFFLHFALSVRSQACVLIMTFKRNNEKGERETKFTDVRQL